MAVLAYKCFEMWGKGGIELTNVLLFSHCVLLKVMSCTFETFSVLTNLCSVKLLYYYYY
jgi:hypothetical protein